MITLNSLIEAKKKLPDPKYTTLTYIDIAITGDIPIYHNDMQIDQYLEYEKITFKIEIFKGPNGIVRLWVYDGSVLITSNN